MRVSNAGLQLIMRFEGFSPTPYRDVAGHLTIGYGHLITPGEQFAELGKADAKQLLQQDVHWAERGVLRQIHIPLTQNRFDALVSFTFNLGEGALQRSTLRQKVNREEHVEVPAEFLRWVWAGGRKWPGLLRRRQSEAGMYGQEEVE